MRREPDEQRGWFSRLLESIPAILWSADPETLAAMHDFDPQVVILDINLPGISGIEVCARIRATNPDQPVILSTGHMTGIHLDPHTRALLKPYSFDELMETCHLLMEE